MYIGTSPPGEFFNPGYDCSDILNRDPKAKDGVYWITLGKKSSPKKVFINSNIFIITNYWNAQEFIFNKF